MGEGTVQFRRKKAFATLYREVAQDGRLSLESRGLLVLMASLPEDWEYSVSGLAKKAGCGKDKLRRILGELEQVGYLAREQSHGSNGKFGGNIYIIQDDAPPLSGKPDNGQPRQRETSPTGFPTQNKNILTVEDKKKPPKAPQGGKRPSKYDLAEDAKPLLLAYVGEDRELHQALGAFIELRTQLRAINSARAVKMLLGELDRLSEGRREDKLLLIRQSVANSWKSVFPLRRGGSPAEQSMPPQRWGWD